MVKMQVIRITPIGEADVKTCLEMGVQTEILGSQGS
jgi:hypothetical protein